MGIECEIWFEKASSICVVVMVHLIHVVGWIAYLHINASISYGLPLYTFPPATE